MTNPNSMRLPLVAIATVTQNRCNLITRLILQLKELDYPDDLYDIFIVDDVSTDDTVEKIQQCFPEVHLTLSNENLGITAGFNMAIRAALNAEKKYKYIWLVDSDVEIEKQSLKPLVELSENDPSIGVAGSMVFEPHDKDQVVTAGFFMDWKKVNIALNVPVSDKIDGCFDVDIIPACSSLTRTNLYRKLGLWDQRFWLYWGDTEWCTRAKMNGYRVCCYGKSRVWHRNWAMVKQDFYYPFLLHDRIRNGLLFSLRYSPRQSIRGLRYLILVSYIKSAFENFTSRPNYSRANEEGVEDFLNGFFLKKDFSSWPTDTKFDEIEGLCKSIRKKLPRNPHIILNQIEDESQREKIKNIFSKHFNRITWEEIDVIPIEKRVNLFGEYKKYITYHIPVLVYHLLKIPIRRSLIISPVAIPFLYNSAAAKHTMLIEPTLRGCVRKNQLTKGFVVFLFTVIKGLKVVYIDLPFALKNCQKLRDAAFDYSTPNKQSSC